MKKMPREINLDHITKIEGHAKMHVQIKGGEVQKVEMDIFEGTRFFEGIVKTRNYEQASPLTSRICGVCSVVHSVTALQAVENAIGIAPSQATRDLRELMHIGGMLQSHLLHLYFLALPDYAGFGDALEMAAKKPQEVARGIRMKRLGNDIIRVIGGREVHPITQRLGGFTRLPTSADLDFLQTQIKATMEDAKKTAELFASVQYPDFERKTLYLALDEPKGYALLGGKLASSDRELILEEDYGKHLDEYVNPYATSKFVTLNGKSYMNGALARLNIKRGKLCGNAKEAIEFASKQGIKFPSCNPFHNNLAQAIEVVHLLCRASSLIENLDLSKEYAAPPAEPPRTLPGHSRGVSVTEAPRGLLFHDYTIEKDGSISWANIITPTCQNLRNMEDDAKEYLPTLLDRPEREIILELEKLVRAYDPCVSCATHFLDVKIERS